MARRIALCVAVSNYQSLAPLPNATRDAQALAHVLQQVAGFDEACVLLDPDIQQLGEATENLFADKEVDDVVLLYFSGHGVKDERGHLYLAVPGTRKRGNGELIRATAVACRDIHETMSGSRSRRQVVILDCCFSGAFADGLQPKDGGHVDLRAQLGGEGRAVLTSSASTQFSFYTSEVGLSTYTQFIVGGIASGEADLNHDGLVTVDELHEYARARVQNLHPAMCPQILPTREGYSIVISATGRADPRLAYAAKVREVADHSGNVSPVAAQVLALRRELLGITHEEAKSVEARELNPRRARAKARSILRKAVYEARSRGELRDRQPLLNELRISLELADAELVGLLAEPISSQRKMALGWRYWPTRALMVSLLLAGLAGITAVAWNLRDYDASRLIGWTGILSAPRTEPVPADFGADAATLRLRQLMMPDWSGEGNVDRPSVASLAQKTELKESALAKSEKAWVSEVRVALDGIGATYDGRRVATYKFRLAVCPDGTIERVIVTQPSDDAKLNGTLKAAIQAVVLPVPPGKENWPFYDDCSRIPYDFTWSGRGGKGSIKEVLPAP